MQQAIAHTVFFIYSDLYSKNADAFIELKVDVKLLCKWIGYYHSILTTSGESSILIYGNVNISFYG